jgi:hypothetical protein
MGVEEEQISVCKKYGVNICAAPAMLKLGVARNVKDKDIFPINGMRYNPEGDTTGWYIWAGEEFTEEFDFFVPLHVKHIEDWRPEVIKYLGLPPGYRFLIGANGYEDVWYDQTLLIP